jgi:hypothetical protein
MASGNGVICDRESSLRGQDGKFKWGLVVLPRREVKGVDDKWAKEERTITGEALRVGSSV